jgi:hypothetical protein
MREGPACVSCSFIIITYRETDYWESMLCLLGHYEVLKRSLKRGKDNREVDGWSGLFVT